MSHRRQSSGIFNQQPVQPTFDIQAGLFQTCGGDTIHTIFAPLHYEPAYAYPLIVWLHGPGSDERQLMRIMPLVSMRNYVAIAPRGIALPASSCEPAAPVRRPSLVEKLQSKALKRAAEAQTTIHGWSQSEEHLHQAEQWVFDCIELASRKFHISPKRIFLAGFDSGGTMAFRVALNHPYRFAGVLSLGGAFPTGRNPLARLPEARQLPVFLAAGRRSAVYGEADVCNDLRLLHTAGLSITLRLYPCGHELMPQMLADFDRWVIDQVTSSAASGRAAQEASPELGDDSTKIV